MAAFPSTTLQFFQQTSAPTGWTKQTTNSDYTLRIVNTSGNVNINNSVNFSSGMVDTTIIVSASTSGYTSTTNSDIPAHTHSITMPSYYGGPFSRPSNPYPSPAFNNTTTVVPNAFGSPSDGNQGGHSHSLVGQASVPASGCTLQLAVKYVDFILVSKN